MTDSALSPTANRPVPPVLPVPPNSHPNDRPNAANPSPSIPSVPAGERRASLGIGRTPPRRAPLKPSGSATAVVVDDGAPRNTLLQQIVYLKQRNDYQQSLHEDEQKLMDELLATKNRTIDGLQNQLKNADAGYLAEMESLKEKVKEREKTVAQEYQDRWKKVKAQLDQEKQTFQEQQEEKLSKLRQQFNDEQVHLRKSHQDELNRTKAEHRKELKKLQVQQEAKIKELEASRAQEVTTAHESSATTVASLERRLEAQRKQYKKEYDEKEQEAARMLEEKNRTITMLRERLNDTNRVQDKKLEEVRKRHERELSVVREKMTEQAEQGKASLMETNRKLEKRVHRLESEKQAARTTADKEQEELRSKHRAELDKMREQREKEFKELKKTYNARIEALEETHADKQKQMEIKLRETVDTASEQQRHYLQDLRTEVAREVEKYEEEMALVGRETEKLRFQLALQATYFKKKEESLVRDYDSKIAVLKSLLDNHKRSQEQDRQHYEDHLRQKDEMSQERDAHILELNDKMAELKLQLQNVKMQGEKNTMVFEQKGHHFVEKLSEANYEKNALRSRLTAVERELRDRLDTIDMLRADLDKLKIERARLQADLENALQSARLSPRARSPSPNKPPAPMSPRRIIIHRSELPASEASPVQDGGVAWQNVEEQQRHSILLGAEDGLVQLPPGNQNEEDDGDAGEFDGEFRIDGVEDVDSYFSRTKDGMDAYIQSTLERIESLQSQLESAT